MKEFFQKVGAWFKSTANKVWGFIKANKLISCVVAVVLVAAIALAIILPIALNGSTGDSADHSNNSEITDSTDSSEEEVNPSSYVYRVCVENQTGYGLKGATVTLKNGDTVVATATSNTNGYANFTDIDVGVYTIELTNLPKGYALDSDVVQKTTTQSGSQYLVALKPTGVIMEEAPSGHSYKLGDVMYDFSIVLSDGSTFTLSEVLKEKNMLLLNFWATWCGPCKSEFPAMNNAAIAYADTVSVLAISTTDGKDAVVEYKQQSGLTFNMANDSLLLQQKFNVGAIPHSVIIDRYGVVVFQHVGSMTAMSDFTNRFDLFNGEDYQSYVVPGDGEDAIDPDAPVVEVIKPNVAAPSLNDVKEVLGGSNEFTYSWDEDEEYSWPWLIGEDAENGKYLYTPTTGINSSFATLIINFTAEAGKALQFDYYINSEEKYDKFYVMFDGGYAHSFSGSFVNEWQTCTAYVFDETLEGEHELILLYYKDEDGSSGDDIVKIKNMRFVDVADLNTPETNINIFRNASWGLNEPGEETQYKYYVDAVYSDVDGYYHVGEANGPILFASLMTVNNWNTYTIWDLAYSNYIAIDGINYGADVETFAWEANNNMFNHGYTPVTQELKELLDIIVSAKIYGEKYECDYHENEWLEICSYYDHYGDTPQVADPMQGITFHAAIPLQEGSNHIDVPFAINPRGFKYKFTPEKSGAYKFYSTGEVDTAAFFADAPNHIIGEYDDLVGAETHVDANGVTILDGNFRFYQYLEAGHTYYILCTTFLDVVAQYNMEIEYIGTTFKYLDNTAVGPYSFNETTGQTYLPDAKEYEYADPSKEYTYSETGETAAGDGYYRIKNKDGSLGSIIYLDVNRPTAMFQSTSLYDVVRQAEANYPDPIKRVFYINGKDYTPDIKKLCFMAMQNSGELNGFVAIDAEVFDLISIIVRGTDGAIEGVNNAWVLLCYYYVYLGA